MVTENDSGQIFTIEGIIAGLIMLSTAFAVVSSVNIYSPGDAHITDMQLSSLGNDALLMLDTPETPDEMSLLAEIAGAVGEGDQEAAEARNRFESAFGEALAMGTGATVIVDSIGYDASVFYRDTATGTICSYPLGESGESIPRQSSVGAGRLVIAEFDGNERIVRVEARLWRE